MSLNLPSEYRVKIVGFRVIYDHRKDKVYGEHSILVIGGRERFLWVEQPKAEQKQGVTHTSLKFEEGDYRDIFYF